MHATLQMRTHDRHQDIEAKAALIVGIEAYLRVHSGTEESKAIVTSCFVEGGTLQWGLQLCSGAHLPPGVISVRAFAQRLTGTYLPRSAREQATVS